jgi:A/G-specific adenine glycosylase
VRRPASGIWAGLWSLPEFDSIEAARGHIAGWPGMSDEGPAFTHVLTHLDLRLQPLHHTLPARARRDEALRSTWPEGRWVGLGELGAFGLPAPVAKLLASALQAA